ncbi:MAG: hypothetical protein ACI81L_000466 [Verrucomicrobiales bacterium]|jgi:hypothetical protein
MESRKGAIGLNRAKTWQFKAMMHSNHLPNWLMVAPSATDGSHTRMHLLNYLHS